MFDIKILEFDKILSYVARLAQTDLAEKAILQTKISTLASHLEQTLERVDELRLAEHYDRRFDFSGAHDLTSLIKDVRLQRRLDAKAMVSVSQTLTAVNRVKKQALRLSEILERDLSVSLLAAPLEAIPTLKHYIDARVDGQGEIKDEASMTLKTVRHKHAQLQKKIKETLDGLMRSEASKLTESLYTVRYDRYVLPVKPSDKNSVKGAIVDYSQSGETVYIEPAIMAQLSAQRRLLEQQELDEIERILWEMTGVIDEHKDVLEHNQSILTELDVLMAKGIYAEQLNASKPRVSQELKLIRARHPLLPPHDVVANTIHLAPPHKMMVITGSNTGGKTVLLKTVGLLALMHQAGMLIPVDEDSSLPIFNAIRADIGDEQSIEQSLSTFSSHLTHLIDIEASAKEQALILLDEVGSGTDPQEGAALAMSYLDRLLTRDVLVFASTHYPELKAFAYDREAVMNASVAFDVETLKPTYRLLMHTPGTSHAFLISERLGLPKAIIEEAKTIYENTQSASSNMIQVLHDESVRLDQLMQTYHEKVKHIQQQEHELTKQLKALHEEKNSFKERLNAKQHQELKQMREDMEAFIESLEAKMDERSKLPLLAEAKQGLSKLAPSVEEDIQSQPHNYAPGDRVLVHKYNREGDLVKTLKGSLWQVKLGALTINLHEHEFTFIDSPKHAKQKIASHTPTKRVAMQCDLRGLRLHEAEEMLEKYLDDCAVADVPFATIVHGFGTLAIRNMVKLRLKDHPLVLRHRDGFMNEGGQGATIVYFKET